MSDFTLDYFFTQLLRYLERTRRNSSGRPKASTPLPRPQTGCGRGWFLSCGNAKRRSRPGSGSPARCIFYLVYVQNDGRIRYGCANARQVLEAFEMVAIGQDKPIRRLCDQFNSHTENGRNMIP